MKNRSDERRENQANASRIGARRLALRRRGASSRICLAAATRASRIMAAARQMNGDIARDNGKCRCAHASPRAGVSVLRAASKTTRAWRAWRAQALMRRYVAPDGA
jgi:hypothetical protein